MNDYKAILEEKNKLNTTDKAGIVAGLTSGFYLTAMQLEPIKEAMANLDIHNDFAIAGTIGVGTGLAYLVAESISKLFGGKK
ncbi:MAG: hypothetical protein KKA65_03370 [Nanoarchaeota archaeon]|nr:hypothetical protein [Nanoarchaeota archaeon]MBU4242198.1 hypothetical protein [Nanoarchaeota archaeon]MBU4352035.1 hypothetical protein [Nanoarchaeota archaeon]MBU4456518.1 hypothetical protein [Nanoarchaeota archaeon]MCG2719306.1 hypothetical protein [Nanoarchaeota archaeon]